jgi:hypothetical protein
MLAQKVAWERKLAEAGSTNKKHQDKCQENNLDRCSLDYLRDVGNWWTCISERSDWCHYFLLLLTSGIIQIASVPLIFALLFWITEL